MQPYCFLSDYENLLDLNNSKSYRYRANSFSALKLAAGITSKMDIQISVTERSYSFVTVLLICIKLFPNIFEVSLMQAEQQKTFDKKKKVKTQYCFKRILVKFY